MFIPVLTLFSQSGMGSHDTFIDTETWSACKWEAGRQEDWHHFQAILGYIIRPIFRPSWATSVQNKQTNSKMSRIGKEDGAEEE